MENIYDRYQALAGTANDLRAEVSTLRKALEEIQAIALNKSPGFQSLDRASIATIAEDALAERATRNKPKHRLILARERAGLTQHNAAVLLGTTVDTLNSAETATGNPPEWMIDFMCDKYQVRREWLLGEVEQHDYAALDAIKGADELGPQDRKTIAEFMAALPRKK